MKKIKKILAVGLSLLMMSILVQPISVYAEDETIQISTAEQFVKNIKSGTTVELTTDIQLSEELYLKNVSDITIKGNGHTITASDEFKTNSSGQIQLVKVEDGENIVLDNVVLKATDKNKHVLDVYNASVIVNNATLDHSSAQSGAPLIVNQSNVIVKGKTEFITGKNSWYAINVDPREKSASLTIEEDANVSFSGDLTKAPVYVETKESGTATVNGLDNLGSIGQGDIYGNKVASIGDANYYSVQAAINAAQNGDTVTVKAGRHDEEVVILNKAIHLVGEDGAELFDVVAINTTDDELEGLSIENIHFYGASSEKTADVNPSTIYIQGKYKDVVIKDNEMILEERRVHTTVPSDYSIAITTSQDMNGLTVQNNVIKNYTMSAYHNPDWSNPTNQVSQNIIYDGNSFENILSGIYFGGVKDAVVVNNTFTKSNGVRIAYGTSVSQIENNKFISRPDDKSFGDYAVRFYEDGLKGDVDLSNNYWGTKDIASVIDNQGQYDYKLDTYYVSEDLNDKNIDTNIFELGNISVELQEGSKLTVEVTAIDYDGNLVEVQWSSADEKVAVVKDGVITAMAEGKTVITVEANGKVRTIHVVVTKKITEQTPSTDEEKPPVDVTPTTPVKPETPVQPAEPTKPATPVQPTDTVKPAEPTDKGETVDTGDKNAIALYGSICALAIVGAGIVVLKKKREDALNK